MKWEKLCECLYFGMWEREREIKLKIKKNEKKKHYLNRIKCRIDKLIWVVLKSGYVKIEKVGS